MPQAERPVSRDDTSSSSAVSSKPRLTREEIDKLRAAEIVLIGETHDHPEHHVIQAQVIRTLKPKVVAFEMLDQRHQEMLDQLPKLPKETWDQALDWTKRGWPDFELYRPVFVAALDVGARLLAAHPTPQTLHPLMLGKELPRALRARLKLDLPLPQTQQRELSKLIHDAHCGYANEVMVSAMIKAQRLKDAWMAEQLIKTVRPVVLIVGREHAHHARGIPWAFEQLDPELGRRVVTLALSPPAPSTGQTPTEQITLTIEPHRRDDPCERFRKQLEKMKSKHKAHPPSSGSKPASRRGSHEHSGQR